MSVRMANPRIRAGWPVLLSLLLIVAGCSGGGGTSHSGNGAGAAAVTVSVASSPAYPAGTAFTATPLAVDHTSKPVDPPFDNVLATIVKVALIPADGKEGPDPNGEPCLPDDGGKPEPGIVTSSLHSPKVIDLLNLPSGPDMAMFLHEFIDVPAGTYGKIRMYYSEIVGIREGSDPIPFHPTANSHFDIHFVGEKLVIPLGTDALNSNGIRLYDVTIHFVGLKITENKNKVLMRPQVFAKLKNLLYSVSGIADNVSIGSKEFDIATASLENPSVHAVFDQDTQWSFEDPVEGRRVDVASANGFDALREDLAAVKAIGMFSGGELHAERIVISFFDFLEENVASGTPTDGWKADNTFELNLPSDNVVFPRPDRAGAVYDNGVSGVPDNAVVLGARVKARGYPVAGGIDAFWITIFP